MYFLALAGFLLQVACAGNNDNQSSIPSGTPQFQLGPNYFDQPGNLFLAVVAQEESLGHEATHDVLTIAEGIVFNLYNFTDLEVNTTVLSSVIMLAGSIGAGDIVDNGTYDPALSLRHGMLPDSNMVIHDGQQPLTLGVSSAVSCYTLTPPKDTDEVWLNGVATGTSVVNVGQTIELLDADPANDPSAIAKCIATEATQQLFLTGDGLDETQLSRESYANMVGTIVGYLQKSSAPGAVTLPDYEGFLANVQRNQILVNNTSAGQVIQNIIIPLPSPELFQRFAEIIAAHGTLVPVDWTFTATP